MLIKIKKRDKLIILFLVLLVSLFLILTIRKKFNPILSETLSEVSGIVYIGDNNIAAVQDEVGSIFIFNIIKKIITEEIAFGNVGDYEGIAYTGDSYFILRSDGILFEYKDNGTKSYNLQIDANNSEGLCFDKKNNRLLIATKSKVDKGKEFKDLRYIYEFNLNNKTLSQEPAIIINIKEIENYANVNSIELTAESDIGKKLVKFRPSGLAIHPLTNYLYIISAIDNLVIILGEDGKIVSVKQLDFDLFPQPEGITFLPDGKALIANESKTGEPKIIELEL